MIRSFWILIGIRILVFFFQAEDGIRDVAVTGVQTCALPICAALDHLYQRVLLASDREFQHSFSGQVRFLDRRLYVHHHPVVDAQPAAFDLSSRSEEHTSELQSRLHLVCRLLLEKKKTTESTREATRRRRFWVNGALAGAVAMPV